MLPAFSDAEGIIHQELVAYNRIVSGKLYSEAVQILIIALGQSFRKVGPGTLCNLQAMSTSFRPALSHPLYSTDLAPAVPLSCEERDDPGACGERFLARQIRVDRLRVPGYRSRGPDSIPGATRFSEK
jgi:hypothetical protein